MASDTDLWLGLKARQARYKNVFGATKELSPVEDERSNVLLEGGGQHESPVATDGGQARRHDQDEMDKRLKAKRAVFTTKGRSLSLASFRLLPSSGKKQHHHHKLGVDKNGGKVAATVLTTPKENKDEKYLKEYRAQGELDILNLESLINVNDVRKRSSK